MDAQEQIDRGTQQLVRGYPLAAGLTSVANGEYQLAEGRALMSYSSLPRDEGRVLPLPLEALCPRRAALT